MSDAASRKVALLDDEYQPDPPIALDPSRNGVLYRFTMGLTPIPAVGGVYAQGFISHGLGATPVAVVAVSEDGEQYATVQNRTSTQFLCTSKKTNGVTNSGVNIHWIAMAYN